MLLPTYDLFAHSPPPGKERERGKREKTDRLCHSAHANDDGESLSISCAKLPLMWLLLLVQSDPEGHYTREKERKKMMMENAVRERENKKGKAGEEQKKEGNECLIKRSVGYRKENYDLWS